jgi:hypothetical protein
MAYARRLGYTLESLRFELKGSCAIDHGDFRHVVILVACAGAGSRVCFHPRRRLRVHNAQATLRQAFSAAFALNAVARALRLGSVGEACQMT